LDGYVTREGLGTDVRALIYDRNGDLISGGILYEAFSNLEKITGAIIDPNTNQVKGIYAQNGLESAINDYITNSSSIANVITWA